MKKLIAFLILALIFGSIHSTDPLKIPDDSTPRIAFKLLFDPEKHAEIDVLIAYTDDAEQWASTRGGIEKLVLDGFVLSNQTAQNSDVGITFKLRKLYKTDYVETGNSLTDLRRVTFGYSGVSEWQDTIRYAEDIRMMRDSVGADLVIFVPGRANSAGLGWQLSMEAGRPQYGYSLVAVHYINQLSKVHEIGHNMGAHHHKQQLSSPGPGLYDFSAGWGWTGNDGKNYVSTMSYSSGYPDGWRGSRVPYFSNPNAFYKGVATGDIFDADNASTLKMTKHVISMYRDKVVDPEDPEEPIDTIPEIEIIPIQTIDTLQPFWIEVNSIAGTLRIRTSTIGPWRRILKDSTGVSVGRETVSYTRGTTYYLDPGLYTLHLTWGSKRQYPYQYVIQARIWSKEELEPVIKTTYDIVVYPNPTPDGFFTLENKEGKPIRITFMNHFGSQWINFIFEGEIWTYPPRVFYTTTNGLSRGTYYIVCYDLQGKIVFTTPVISLK